MIYGRFYEFDVITEQRRHVLFSKIGFKKRKFDFVFRPDLVFSYFEDVFYCILYNCILFYFVVLGGSYSY